ncbi:MAG: DUF6477 family protein [Pseudomonadota bacterium]
MCNITDKVNMLRRPRLLVDAATLHRPHLGAEGDARAWRRIVRKARPRRCAARLSVLLEIETDLERRRQLRCRRYAPRRHVDVLAFLLSEFEEALTYA